MVVVFNPSILGFGEDEPIYEPIGFDANQTRWYAQELVNLGHPEWEGRMSGSPEEAAAAQMILDNLTEMGYSPQLNTYPVPMFAINSAPIISMCIPPAGWNLWWARHRCILQQRHRWQITTFEHRTDFVLQGYSGSADIQFGQEMELIDLDDGTIDALWTDASGKVGIVRGGNSIDGNTGIYIKAAENGLAAILRINNQSNCGQIVADDCIPIFKSIRVDDMKAANSGSIPENIPFIAVSNNTGNQMLELASQGAFLRLFSDVDNAGDLSVSVPCGTLYGKSEDLIIVGAHHDTVYHAQGAVDDSSGTASVLEMARQIALIANQSGTPEYTLRFCTWGGEEEGLWGSKAYVGANGNELARNLRLYINLDMNHVDIDTQIEETVFGSFPIQKKTSMRWKIFSMFSRTSDLIFSQNIQFRPGCTRAHKVNPMECLTTQTMVRLSMIFQTVLLVMHWCVMGPVPGNIIPMQTPWIDSMRNRWECLLLPMERTSATSLGPFLSKR